MAKLELTRDKVVNQVPKLCFELCKLLLDNSVTSGKTKSAELKTLVDALDVTIQAASRFDTLD